ncbi:MAG: phosphate signaling complex protein PhoU [Bacilli bacterium]
MLIEKEIEYLNQILLKMADHVEFNISEAFKAYVNCDKSIYVNDDIIDQYERLIEEVCLDILLKEKLYAKDLRKVTGILRMVADLERIGDHAEDIIEYNQKTNYNKNDFLESFQETVSVALSMVIDSILSFVNEDYNLAKDVINRDEIVDGKYSEWIEYIAKLDQENIIDSKLAIYTTIMVKYIERIADHAVNIAEWAVYMINGYYKDKQIF